MSSCSVCFQADSRVVSIFSSVTSFSSAYTAEAAASSRRQVKAANFIVAGAVLSCTSKQHQLELKQCTVSRMHRELCSSSVTEGFDTLRTFNQSRQQAILVAAKPVTVFSVMRTCVAALSALSAVPSKMSLPPLSLISEATLKTKDGQEVKAKELWATQPVFLYCIR